MSNVKVPLVGEPGTQGMNCYLIQQELRSQDSGSGDRPSAW
jgi:hypothetical protein